MEENKEILKCLPDTKYLKGMLADATDDEGSFYPGKFYKEFHDFFYNKLDEAGIKDIDKIIKCLPDYDEIDELDDIATNKDEFNVTYFSVEMFYDGIYDFVNDALEEVKWQLEPL